MARTLTGCEIGALYRRGVGSNVSELEERLSTRKKPASGHFGWRPGPEAGGDRPVNHNPPEIAGQESRLESLPSASGSPAPAHSPELRVVRPDPQGVMPWAEAGAQSVLALPLPDIKRWRVRTDIVRPRWVALD